MINEDDYKVLPEDYQQYDLSFKIIVIGDSGVGKSCITTKATKNIFEGCYNATIGFEFHTFKINIKDKVIRLQIWDTCGQEIYRSLIRGFYTNSSLAILVYSIDSMQSFKNLESWLNDIKTNSNPDVKIFLIGNKNDLENKREVSFEQGEQFYKEHDLNLFMESSAKSGFNIEKIFAQAAYILYEENKKINKNIVYKSDIQSENVILSRKKTDDYYTETPLVNKKKKKCC